MNELLKIVNKETDGRFKDLRLRKAVLDDRDVGLEFSFPRLISQSDKDEISRVVIDCVPRYFSVKIKFLIDKFDCEVMQRTLLKHIEKHYLPFYSGVCEGIGVAADESIYKVKISADADFIAVLNKNNVIDELNAFIKNYTVFPVIIETQPVESGFDLNEELERIQANQALMSLAVKKEKRFIETENYELLIGGMIKAKPVYISDVNEELNSCTVCGKIKKTDILTSKKEGAKYKYICKAVIEDFTGSIEIVFFCGEKLMPLFQSLNAGEEIIVSGSSKLNMSRLNSYNSVIARSISKCKILPTKVVSIRAVPDSYTRIKPFAYESQKQIGMLDCETLVDECFINTNYVAFDIETTGLTYYSDKIVEIGAVRIIDGKITECFNTLINPECPINPNATRISGITDSMVKDSPRLSEVIGDFVKFCHDSTLIAHNVGFDYSFISYGAHAFDYEFRNNKIDTIEIAKKFFEKRSSIARPHNYKLQTLAASLDIDVREAHRALDDARVCAEVFLKLVNSEPSVINDSIKKESR